MFHKFKVATLVIETLQCDERANIGLLSACVSLSNARIIVNLNRTL